MEKLDTSRRGNQRVKGVFIEIGPGRQQKEKGSQPLPTGLDDVIKKWRDVGIPDSRRFRYSLTDAIHIRPHQLVDIGMLEQRQSSLRLDVRAPERPEQLGLSKGRRGGVNSHDPRKAEWSPFTGDSRHLPQFLVHNDPVKIRRAFER